jgi:D-proline reductase (dithiol) PrdB
MIDELRGKIRAQYKPDFDFTSVGDVPFTAPAKPVAASRIALISTAGVHLDDQEPFDRATPSGDCSYRRIAAGDDLARVRIWWDTDQHQPGSQDLNCAFPLALLREKYDVAATHYSFSGAIPDPRPLLEQTAPAVASELKADAVEAVLIAPS